MHRSLAVGSVFFVLAATILGVQGAEPVLVFVEPDGDDKALMYLNAVSEFDCLDKLEPIQTLYFKDNSYYQISNPEDFDSKTGLVYFLSSSNLKRGRFWTVSGPEVFHDFLDFLKDARGSGVVVEGDEFRKKLTVPSTKPQPGVPHITWQDLYVTYDDGVIYLGNSEIWGLKGAARLKAVVKQSVGKDWFLWASTKHVPATARNVFMSALGLRAGVQMQRRDEEDEATFTSRRAFHVSYMEAMRSIVFDLDEIIAWTEFPKSDEPFRAFLRFDARQNSQLSQSLRKVRIVSRAKETKPKMQIGTATACFRVPEEFRPLCERYLSHHLGDWQPANALMRSVLRNGDVDLRASVGVTKEDVPVVLGMVRLDESVRLRDIGLEAGLSIGPKETLRVERKLPQLLRFFNDVSLKQFGATIQFAMSNSDVVDTLIQPHPDETAYRYTSIVDVNLDLGKIRDWPDIDLATEFVRDLEQSYQRAKLLSRLGRAPFMAERVLNGEDFFHSVSEKVLQEGDWRILFKLQADGTSATVSATVGREAYYWYIVRELLAQASEMKL